MTSDKLTNPGSTALAMPSYGAEMTGMGFDNVDASFFKIPFLNVIQSLSPQRQRGNPKFIEGAEEGKFFDSANGRLYDGVRGIRIVPVYVEQAYMEYTPREKGGGVVGRHAINAPIVRETAIPRFGKAITKSGTELVRTFDMFFLNLGEMPNALENWDGTIRPMIITFWSTKIPQFQRFMDGIDSIKRPAGQAREPLAAHQRILTTFLDPRKKGTSFNVRLQVPGLDPAAGPSEGQLISAMLPSQVDGKPSPILTAARDLYLAVKGGTATVDHSQRSGENEPESTEAAEATDKAFS